MDGLLYYAWGFMAGLLRALGTPPQEKRHAALGRWTAQWRTGVRHLLQSDSPFSPAPRELFPLKSALVGRTRGEIAALLGPPPATSAQPLPASRRGKWQADTWYYPLDRSRRRAIAINFHNHIAHAIEQVPGPGY
jgi:hypothetical protein